VFAWDSRSGEWPPDLRAAIQEFVKGRPHSDVYRWGFPSPGLLPGIPPAQAVTTLLLVTKSLHIGRQPSSDPWITAELRFRDGRGSPVGFGGRCHLHRSGRESRDPVGRKAGRPPRDDELIVRPAVRITSLCIVVASRGLSSLPTHPYSTPFRPLTPISPPVFSRLRTRSWWPTTSRV
jgi:hypothetical protein